MIDRQERDKLAQTLCALMLTTHRPAEKEKPLFEHLKPFLFAKQSDRTVELVAAQANVYWPAREKVPRKRQLRWEYMRRLIAVLRSDRSLGQTKSTKRPGRRAISLALLLAVVAAAVSVKWLGWWMLPLGWIGVSALSLLLDSVLADYNDVLELFPFAPFESSAQWARFEPLVKEIPLWQDPPRKVPFDIYDKVLVWPGLLLLTPLALPFGVRGVKYNPPMIVEDSASS